MTRIWPLLAELPMKVARLFALFTSAGASVPAPVSAVLSARFKLGVGAHLPGCWYSLWQFTQETYWRSFVAAARLAM
jgi:hypothetical protein